MDIQFKTDRLDKVCNSRKAREKEWGERRAKILGRRLDDLHAAETLDDMRNMPGDCHVYKKRTDGTLTLDLDGGWRLFFKPFHRPLPVLSDGTSLDWTKVTAVEITDMRDPHD
jgi:proteic killer suppression protein